MGWRKAKEAGSEALEEVGKFMDLRDRIGAWCAALGSIGAGVLFYIGPDTIKEEIPIHKELGIGFGAFGFVFLCALMFKGSLGYRFRSLLFAMLPRVARWELAGAPEVAMNNTIRAFATLPVKIR